MNKFFFIFFFKCVVLYGYCLKSKLHFDSIFILANNLISRIEDLTYQSTFCNFWKHILEPEQIRQSFQKNMYSKKRKIRNYNKPQEKLEIIRRNKLHKMCDSQLQVTKEYLLNIVVSWTKTIQDSTCLFILTYYVLIRQVRLTARYIACLP